ncbi:MAG: ribonuclease HI [Rhizobiaceae bacterium]|nr:ribonuclease HI [Rhizobiaceae bacterium]
MIDISDDPEPPANAARLPELRQGLHIFTDGSYEPGSGHGGWAFVAYRDSAEIACAFGGAPDSANNSMELFALLEAATWVNGNVAGETVTIWTDSNQAVKGCNGWRHIWKTNGWKKITPNTRSRKRTIENADLWKSIDLQLSSNHLISVAWCKGHAGIDGNERADQLADQGRLSVRRGR